MSIFRSTNSSLEVTKSIAPMMKSQVLGTQEALLLNTLFTIYGVLEAVICFPNFPSVSINSMDHAKP